MLFYLNRNLYVQYFVLFFRRDFLMSKSQSSNVTDAEIADMKKQIIYLERKMKAESYV